MSKILVTGASGKIGSCVTEKLLDKGHDVVGVYRGNSRENSLKMRGIYSDISNEKLDIRSAGAVKDVVKNYEPDYVMHLAAMAEVSKGLENPVSAYETNVMGTVNLMEAVRNEDESIKILNMSTDKALGGIFSAKVDDRLQATGPYGTSKASAEFVGESYSKMYGLDVITARSVNVYGYEARPKRIVSKTITRCMEGQEPIIFTDIEGIRNYVYVEDAAEALIHLLFNETGKHNISTEDVLGQKEVVEKILEYFPETEPRYEKRDIGDKEVARQSMKRSEFDWEPSYDFDTGLEKTIEAFKEYGYNGY